MLLIDSRTTDIIFEELASQISTLDCSVAVFLGSDEPSTRFVEGGTSAPVTHGGIRGAGSEVRLGRSIG